MKCVFVAGCEEGPGRERPWEDTGPLPQRLSQAVWKGCCNHGQYIKSLVN